MKTVLEQELASIMKFTLDRAENPSPYYYTVPQSFNVPAVHFPIPEISTGGETFLTYNMEYVWFIKLFHKTSREAYALGLTVLAAIKGNRNLIPLVTTEGEVTVETFRIDDPKLKMLDDGAAQLSLSWTSRRPYTTTEAVKMQTYEVESWNKNAYVTKEISEAFAETMEQYSTVLPSTNKEP